MLTWSILLPGNVGNIVIIEIILFSHIPNIDRALQTICPDLLHRSWRNTHQLLIFKYSGLQCKCREILFYNRCKNCFRCFCTVMIDHKCAWVLRMLYVIEDKLWIIFLEIRNVHNIMRSHTLLYFVIKKGSTSVAIKVSKSEKKIHPVPKSRF